MAKIENYSAEMTAAIVNAYTAAGTERSDSAHEKRAKIVKMLADEFGKSERSIRSKLVTEGKYIKKDEKSGVTGEKPEKKEVLAQRVSDAFGSESIDGKPYRLNPVSLEKMGKMELQALFNRFNSEIVEDFDTDVEPENRGELTD